MATQDYYRWVQAGKPFRRPPWLVELRALAEVHGVQFLGDLGNDEHLKASRPQDHTPYSYTEWPVQIAEYVINAIDLARGAWAYRLLEAAKTGRAPWLKYLNVDGQHYNIKNGWDPVASSDVHGHVSGRTDHTWTGLNGLNPFIDQEVDQDMTPAESNRLQWGMHMLETPDDAGKMLEVCATHPSLPNPVAGRPYQLGIQLNRIEHKLDELLKASGAVTQRAPLAAAPMSFASLSTTDEPEPEGDGGVAADGTKNDE